jgi:hypothetical protein
MSGATTVTTREAKAQMEQDLQDASQRANGHVVGIIKELRKVKFKPFDGENKERLPRFLKQYENAFGSMDVGWLMTPGSMDDKCEACRRFLDDSRRDEGLPQFFDLDRDRKLVERHLGRMSKAAMVAFAAGVTDDVATRCGAGWQDLEVWDAVEKLVAVYDESELDAQRKLLRLAELRLEPKGGVNQFIAEATVVRDSVVRHGLSTERGICTTVLANLPEPFKGAVLAYAGVHSRLTLEGLRGVLERVLLAGGKIPATEPKRGKGVHVRGDKSTAGKRKQLYSREERRRNGVCRQFDTYGECKWAERCRFEHVQRARTSRHERNKDDGQRRGARAGAWRAQAEGDDDAEGSPNEDDC